MRGVLADLRERHVADPSGDRDCRPRPVVEEDPAGREVDAVTEDLAGHADLAIFDFDAPPRLASPVDGGGRLRGRANATDRDVAESQRLDIVEHPCDTGGVR